MSEGEARVADPRVSRSRETLIDAARRVFIASGYDGASMDDVAAVAGVSRRTAFNVFGTKEELFRQTVLATLRIADRFTADLRDRLRELDDPAASLPALARRLARDVLEGPVVPVRRLVSREAARFPDLAAEYYRRGPGAVLDELTAALRRLGDAGLLGIPDARVAAEHFAFLVLGPELDRRMFAVDDVSPADRERRAELGAEAFLRAYPPPARRTRVTSGG